MRQTEEVWNMNTIDDFNTSWMNVLGESTMERFKNYNP